jgi:hypothetical protein
MRTSLTFLLIFIFSIGISSAQSNQLKVVLEQLQIKESECMIKLIKERPIPFDKSKSLIFIPKISYQDESSYNCDVYLIVFETKTGKILNRFYESDALWSDAIHCDEVLFDFAPYKLDVKTRAFGVRFKFSNESIPNPYRIEYLSLFVLQKDSLIQVLKDFPVFEFSGEYDTQCTGEFIEEKKILIIDGLKTNSYSDIIVKSTIKNTTTFDVNGDCKEKNSVNLSTSRLKFLNGTYPFK